jgi:polyhydroxybutyrate depolymerase
MPRNRQAFALLLGFMTACSSSSHARSSSPSPLSTTHTVVTTAPCTPVMKPGAHELTWHGVPRSYSVALPPADGGKHPLLVLFHGFASSREAIAADTGLDKLGPERGYVVVTPDGTGNPKSWMFFGDAGNDEFDLVNAIVDRVEKGACVDRRREFAAGHSAGSAFAGFLVCHQPYRFAGVAMVSATVPSSCPESKRYSVIGIHGTADPIVLYNGGLGAGQSTPIPPILQTIAAYAKRLGCEASPRHDKPAGDIERTQYQHCAGGRGLTLETVVGGGHPWPGGLQATHTPPIVRSSASTAVLDFFDAHS